MVKEFKDTSKERRFREFQKYLRSNPPSRKTFKLWMRKAAVVLGKYTDTHEPISDATVRRYLKQAQS